MRRLEPALAAVLALFCHTAGTAAQLEEFTPLVAYYHVNLDELMEAAGGRISEHMQRLALQGDPERLDKLLAAAIPQS